MISQFVERRVRAQVEGQLRSSGQFDPLQLLVAIGRLSGQSLESWRNTDGSLLEDHIMGDIGSVLAELSCADSFVQALNLVGCTRQNPARISAFENPKLARKLQFIWQRDPLEQQMDLFFDNKGTQALNRLKSALLSGDPESASELLRQFESCDPNNKLLGAAAQLISAMKQFLDSPDTRSLVWWCEMIPGSINDNAQKLLGDRCDEFLRPFWCYLGRRLDHSPPPRETTLMPEAAWVVAAQWHQAIASIKARPDWLDEHDSCKIMLDCLQQTGEEAELLGVLFQCFWQHPDLAEHWLDHTNNHGWLNRAWEDFSDHEQPLPLQDFPAWITLKQPRARQAQADYRGAPKSFQFVSDGIDKLDLMPFRNTLMNAHPELFEAAFRT